MAGREKYRVDLESVPDGGPPGPIRLKRFLKAALRAYGLRYTAAVELHNDSARESKPETEGDAAC